MPNSVIEVNQPQITGRV